MHIENSYEVAECLATRIKEEFDKGIDCINTCEMGQAIDMLKDISEAMYYFSVVHEMKESKEESTYNPVIQPARLSADMYMKPWNKSSEYTEGYQAGIRDSQPDYREGHSGNKRMTFMISKEIHDGNTADDMAKNSELLTEYLDALCEDMEELTSMLNANEKATLKNKMNAMLTKIV